MKKELLLTTTIAGLALGATAAGAVTGTMSGHNRVGLVDVDKDTDTGSTGTTNQSYQASFTVSLEETLDSGTKISTSFDLADEGADEVNSSGLTLTFTDGSSLQLIGAGEASDNHDAAVPGASGEQGITANTSNVAKSGIDGVSASNAVGFDYSSVADAFGTDGLSWSLSYSNGDETAETDSVNTDSSLSAGMSYVSTTGDTTVTVGAGFLEASDANTSTNNDTSVYHVGVVAENGDVTVGVGIGSGEFAADAGAGVMTEVFDWEAVEAGIKYVSGDITFTANYSDASGNDVTKQTTAAATDKADGHETMAMSVDYAVASGVTTTIGYASIENSHEGSKNQATSGSSWYVGTDLSF